MIKIPQFEYISLHTLDVGFLLEDWKAGSDAIKSHRELADKRSDAKIHKLLESNIPKSQAERKDKLGTFLDPIEEGNLLSVNIEKACKDGGKPIFTQHFLSNRSPIVFQNEEPPAPLFLPGLAQSLPKITPNFPFSLHSGRSKFHYKGAKLRLFPHGTLGIEMRFACNDGFREKAGPPLEPKNVIEDIVSLEEEVILLGCYFKYKTILETLNNAIGLKNYNWRDALPEFPEFVRLSGHHRVLVVNGLLEGKNYLNADQLRISADRLRTVSGLLNRARWFENYSEDYLEEIKLKFIGYQLDELFITEGDSTLILFPGHWSNRKNKTQYMENLIVSMHYLLSWEATLQYFESFVERSNIGALVDFVIKKKSSSETQSMYADLTRVQNFIRFLRDAVSIRSLINHGFTTKVLEQFFSERQITKRINDLFEKLSSVSQCFGTAVSYAKERHRETKISRLRTVAIIIALISLIISAIFNVLNFLQKNSKAPIKSPTEQTQVNSTGPKEVFRR